MPVPGEKDAITNQAQVHAYLQRLHIGLGHCGQAEFIQHLKDAGADSWLVEQARRFSCPVCEAHKPPEARRIAGGPKPRSFNSVLTIDTLDLTLERDSVQYRIFLLTAVDAATSFSRAFALRSGDAQEAVATLQRGWVEAYGAPEYIYCDPDTIFRSEHFAQYLTRNAVVERLSAAQAPHQHGQVERFHRTLRQQAQKVFESERSCTPYEAVVHVVQARNELMRVEGVSPAVLVFGKLPRAPPSMAEGDEDYRVLAERLHNEDPLYEVTMQRRLAARTAWVQSEVRDRMARIQGSRSRPYKGPYCRGQVVLVYRRKRGDSSNPGRRGVWIGPGEIIAVESTSDKLVPRVIYVTVHGRLFLCSPEQLRPVSVQAEWLRARLQEEGLGDQKTFNEMRQVRGVDVRNERPNSAELEQESEKRDEDLALEELKGESFYEPLPQGALTPVPGTPTPGTPVPGTPRPPQPSAPADVQVPPIAEPTPTGGDAPVVVDAPQSSVIEKRGDKRPPGEHPAVEAMSEARALSGPAQGPALQAPLKAAGETVTTGRESSARGRSRTPPPRAGSMLAYADFEGEASDHVEAGWFTESVDHDYSGVSIGVEFDMELDEIQDEQSVLFVIRELCWSAAAARKRNAEVVEKYLSADEKVGKNVMNFTILGPFHRHHKNWSHP
ncbi:hypothetical protein AK812_SmicGene12587 [Symbiodinium microadriaticum]|uniref:Integrase catalytic domain-containing protein n=1 Tax=Symbiodinium microadriaticum TaxID=2951 RepID=A0A1Q9EAB9_SYMMI|nr:hypothetical protein AK812_SmicGene12587 [Symbiodinium microadriaticum]